MALYSLNLCIAYTRSVKKSVGSVVKAGGVRLSRNTAMRSDRRPVHHPSKLTARAISIPATVSESTASSIMSTFASLVSG